MPRPHKVFVLNDEQRQLVEDNILLLYKCWDKMKVKYRFMDKDELYDCCTEAAMNTAVNLDAKKGKYSTLLYVAAERNVLKRIRYWDRECRKNTMKSMSLDYYYSDEESSLVESFTNRYLGVEDAHEWLANAETERLLSVLNEKERDIIYKLYVLGMRRGEVAEEYGMTRRGIEYHINAAKEKMRKVCNL